MIREGMLLPLEYGYRLLRLRIDVTSHSLITYHHVSLDRDCRDKTTSRHRPLPFWPADYTATNDKWLFHPSSTQVFEPFRIRDKSLSVMLRRLADTATRMPEMLLYFEALSENNILRDYGLGI